MTEPAPGAPIARAAPVAAADVTPLAAGEAASVAAADAAPVAVVGGGAVGSFLAVLLARGGERVVVVEQPGTGRARVDLRLRDPAGALLEAQVERVDDPVAVLPSPALAVFAVKMPDLAAAMVTCAAAWPDAPFVTLENGLGAEELAGAARPNGPLVAGSLVAPVDREPDGTLAWRRRRGLALAVVVGTGGPAIARLRTALGRSGLPVVELPDWRAMKWSKLLTNLVANATCAVVDRDPAAVYADRRLFDVERAQVLEALAVMGALGLRPIRLPSADVRLLALGFRAPAWLAYPILRRVVGGARGGKPPSLALHVRAAADLGRGGGAGGGSEAPWLNGGVARAAVAAGLAAPINAMLAALVDEVAASPDRRAALRDRDLFLATIGHATATAREP